MDPPHRAQLGVGVEPVEGVEGRDDLLVHALVEVQHAQARLALGEAAVVDQDEAVQRGLGQLAHRPQRVGLALRRLAARG